MTPNNKGALNLYSHRFKAPFVSLKALLSSAFRKNPKVSDLYRSVCFS